MLKPWEYAPPPFLYKYLPPKRFHVLTDCAFRFTQRSVYLAEDEREMMPEVAAFGSEEKVRELIEQYPDWRALPQEAKDEMVRLALDPTTTKARAEEAQGHMRSKDTYGIFSMTDNPASKRLWDKYGVHGKGFVIGFEIGSIAFQQFRQDTLMGKVRYTDEPLPFFLDDVNAASFYQKRMSFKYESEWRMLKRLDRLRKSANDVFLQRFSPKIVTRIMYLPTCEVIDRLRHLKRKDYRYRRTQLVQCEETQLESE
jgi:hypothetical protein